MHVHQIRSVPQLPVASARHLGILIRALEIELEDIKEEAQLVATTSVPPGEEEQQYKGKLSGNLSASVLAATQMLAHLKHIRANATSLVLDADIVSPPVEAVEAEARVVGEVEAVTPEAPATPEVAVEPPPQPETTEQV